jgi:hypothetical protein
MTILDQRFNLCQASKIRGLISEFVKEMNERMSVDLKCPLQKGLLKIKNIPIPKSAIKQMSPAFGSTATLLNNTKVEFSFAVKVTVLTRVKEGLIYVFEYIADEIKLSQFT